MNLTSNSLPFRPEPGMIQIEDKLTFDMELYFTLDDLTSLYTFDLKQNSEAPPPPP